VIVPDVNLYAHIRGFAHHPRARRWSEHLLNGDTEVGLSAPAVFGFLRRATSPAVFDRPLAIADAVGRVEEWFGVPAVHHADDPKPRARSATAPSARRRKR
jgi:predicted nucleic acid-binding protein